MEELSMKKLCTLHTTDKFIELMSDPFTKPFIQDNPEIEYFDIAMVLKFGRISYDAAKEAMEAGL
jgi:hypothetical protein